MLLVVKVDRLWIQSYNINIKARIIIKKYENENMNQRALFNRVRSGIAVLNVMRNSDII